jgi:hypothetical protein
MRVFGIAGALLVCGLSAGTAQAVEVHRSVTVAGYPQLVWWDIGGFCEIADWHPIVEDCDDDWEDGAKYRTLTAADGATIRERLTDSGPMTYSYEIVESPLPVANYQATFSVGGTDDGNTVIDWVAHFDAAGASEAEAAAVIGGIFDAGLDAIVADRSDFPAQ